MKHLNPRPFILLVVLAVFGGGGWYIDHQRAQQRSVLSGYFESQPTELASRIGGRVARLLVKEGEAVHVGQPLIEFEAAPAAEETAAKQATAEQARQQLREIQNGPRPEDIRKQEAVVAEAQATLTRLRNGPLPEDIAGAKARVRQTQALLQKALAGARPQEIAQARAAEQNAKARLEQSQRGLTAEERAQTKARLDAALAQETLARKESGRTLTLYEEGAISRQQVDRARADEQEATAKRREMEEAFRRAEAGTPAEELRQAQESYRQAKAALDLVLAGSRREDIEAARAEVAQAQAALDELRAGSRKEQIAQAQAATRAAKALARSSETMLEERTLRAPQDGVIERRLVAGGDLVNAGTPVIRMANPQDIWLRVYVPEADLSKVVVGSDAELKLDGIAVPVPAVVESVATTGEFTPANLQTPDERGKQVFSVRLRLKQPDPRIKAGMAATVKRIGQWEL